MTQTFQTNITVMQDADGIMEIFTVPEENGKKVRTMDEYIEREAAIDAVTEVYYNTPDVNLSGEKFEAAINGILAADVAPVVRCKDCKHYLIADEFEGGKRYMCEVNHFSYINSDGDMRYCSYGERKDGADG